MRPDINFFRKRWRKLGRERDKTQPMATLEKHDEEKTSQSESDKEFTLISDQRAKKGKGRPERPRNR